MKKLIVICAASGVGKSTILKKLSDNPSLQSDYVFLEDLLNWWEYKGSEKEDLYYDDCLKEDVRLSDDKNIIVATCMNPYEFYYKVNVPKEITSSFFIGLTCSSYEITQRLKSRPKERMCDSDEFINRQIEYNDWFKKNAGKFQLFIDNTDMSVEDSVNEILEFIKKI